MNPATYIPKQRRAELKRELQRARWGRLLAERMRDQSGDALRESVRAAKALGLRVPEIAKAAGISVPRCYQLLDTKGDK